jgi:hypothetical protein
MTDEDVDYQLIPPSFTAGMLLNSMQSASSRINSLPVFAAWTKITALLLGQTATAQPPAPLSPIRQLLMSMSRPLILAGVMKK